MDDEILNKINIQGELEDEWLVLDTGKYLIHFMSPEIRKKYQLEMLWLTTDLIDNQNNNLEKINDDHILENEI